MTKLVAALGLIRRPMKRTMHTRKLVREYYDPLLLNNTNTGQVRQKVLEILAKIEPSILATLAEKCFHRALPEPQLIGPNYWGCPVDYLMWQHLQTAGSQVTGLGVIFENLVPLQTAFVSWVKDLPLCRWNLCDERGEPLDWLADAAVQTLVIWALRRGLPKTLKWENLDLLPQRSFDSDKAMEMFMLERQFDATLGFVPISGGDVAKGLRLSDRAQRKAKGKYKSLGAALQLDRMSRASEHYVEWYAKRCFLNRTLREIREEEIRSGATNVGQHDDPNDLSAISKGIKAIADVVGFRR